MRAHLAGEAHFGCAGYTDVPDHVKKQFQAINREKKKAEVHKRKMQKLDVMTTAFSSASGSVSQSDLLGLFDSLTFLTVSFFHAALPLLPSLCSVPPRQVSVRAGGWGGGPQGIARPLGVNTVD
eukprot:82552-Chlamydomonas_euryale.AAC.1